MPNSPDNFPAAAEELEGFSTGAADLEVPSDWNIGQPLSFDEGPRDPSEEMSFDFGGFEPSPSSYSLDDLDSHPNPAPDDLDSSDGAQKSEVDTAGVHNTEEPARPRFTKKAKILLVSVLACVGIMSALAVPVYKSMKRPPPAKLMGKKSVRQPIAVPELQEELEFLVLATSEKDTGVISMRLDFLFSASNAFDAFAAKETFYKEAVYQYLLQARPTKNSQRIWQEILEKQLTQFMKEKYPKAGLKTIRVAHWERL